jgi:chromosome segregation ATPase
MAECSEQKLEILKAEFYEMKLKYNQRVMELESALRTAEERLKAMGDLELEAEVFLTNMAESIEGTSSDGTVAALGSLVAVPQSRKMQHILTVTKRCLNLENQLVMAKQAAAEKEHHCHRLEKSLEMCRQALNNAGSPFAIAEEAVKNLLRENEDLKLQLKGCRSENVVLLDRIGQLTSDIDVLSRHRTELLRIRQMLQDLGIQRPLSSGSHGIPEAPFLNPSFKTQVSTSPKAVPCPTQANPSHRRCSAGSKAFEPEAIEIN